MVEARTQGCFQVKIFFSCDQVVQDVGSQCSNTEGLDGSTSPIIQRKLELDKVCASECVFDQHIYFLYFHLVSPSVSGFDYIYLFLCILLCTLVLYLIFYACL